MTKEIRAALAALRQAESAGVVELSATGPAPASAISARESGLEPYFGTVTWTVPPSYRAFLTLHNGLRCGRTVDVNGTGVDYEFDIADEVALVELTADLVHLPGHVSRGDGRYLSTNHLVGFAGAGYEAVWCFDVTQPGGDGEYPVYYDHQDDYEGRARYAGSGEWEFPESATPDFPSFAAWFTTMAGAFAAAEPPVWIPGLGSPGLRFGERGGTAAGADG
ncbi:SMI1/KNR4 family protein [Longispora albida]|uniref:SMI1/KNR4 family protein n=1 Tax=Longispora albida TaxID=203523 RepID=UPI0003A65FB0|nr:SMI1/KNR4 family protein [Longispora albida]